MAGISLISYVGVASLLACGTYSPQAVIVLNRFCKVLNSYAVGTFTTSAFTSKGSGWFSILTLQGIGVVSLISVYPKKLGKPEDSANSFQLSV
jgi:hypothetical protein